MLFPGSCFCREYGFAALMKYNQRNKDQEIILHYTKKLIITIILLRVTMFMDTSR
jgi:hypothetical protein